MDRLLERKKEAEKKSPPKPKVQPERTSGRARKVSSKMAGSTDFEDPRKRAQHGMIGL